MKTYNVPTQLDVIVSLACKGKPHFKRYKGWWLASWKPFNSNVDNIVVGYAGGRVYVSLYTPGGKWGYCKRYVGFKDCFEWAKRWAK